MVVLDVGANVDSTPEMLAQFAVMGEIYSRIIFRNPQAPRRACSPSAKKSTRATNSPAPPLPLLKALPHAISSATWKAATSSAASPTWWCATASSAT